MLAERARTDSLTPPATNQEHARLPLHQSNTPCPSTTPLPTKPHNQTLPITWPYKLLHFRSASSSAAELSGESAHGATEVTGLGAFRGPGDAEEASAVKRRGRCERVHRVWSVLAHGDDKGGVVLEGEGGFICTCLCRPVAAANACRSTTRPLRNWDIEYLAPSPKHLHTLPSSCATAVAVAVAGSSCRQ